MPIRYICYSGEHLTILSMRLLILFVSFLFVSGEIAGQSYARKENNVWIGYADVFWQTGVTGAGIDFNSGAPQSILRNWTSTAVWGSLDNAWGDRSGGATVCDAEGKLLFYTDGLSVLDKNGRYLQDGLDILNHSGNLGPDTSFTNCHRDGVVIMPMPGSSHKYYIFSSTLVWAKLPPPYRPDWYWQWYGKIYATVVDMDLNDGLGAVDTNFRGRLIADSMVGNLHGIVGDNADYWLLGYAIDGSYRAFNITPAGINTTPVISTIPRPLSRYSYDLNVSPDRRKIALGCDVEVQIADFDPATGIVSNGILIGAQGARYAAFSPNSKVLYVSGLIGLRQYDLNNLNTPFTLLTINNYTSAEFDSPLRLASDGKIYYTYMNGQDCHAAHIQQPDLLGTACRAELMADQGFPILKVYCNSLNNEVPVIVYDSVSKVQDAPICLGKPPLLSPNVDGTDYHWMVNTVGTTFVRKGDDNTSSLLATDPGIYAVQYFTASPLAFHRDTFIVRKVNFSLYLGPDQLSCDGAPVAIQAGEIAEAAYLWPDGSTGMNFVADTSGIYWVEVASRGCTARDSIKISVIDIRQNLGSDTTVCKETASDFVLHANVPEGAAVLWSTGATTSSINARDSGVYTVTVSYSECKGSDEVYIQQLYCDCPVSFPSAFSPNGDGNNDRFGVVAAAACPLNDYKLEIFNRWGQLIFISTQPEYRWDGTYKGSPAEAGSYMYRAYIESGRRREETQQQGGFILVR